MFVIMGVIRKIKQFIKLWMIFLRQKLICQFQDYIFESFRDGVKKHVPI